MYPAVAGKFLTDHPDPDPVLLAVRRFDAYPGKKQNAGALLRDMLVNPDRYTDVAVMVDGVEPRTGNRSPLPAAPLNTEEASVEARQLEELQALPIDRQLSRLEQHLALYKVQQHLSVMDRDRLRMAILKGEVSVLSVMQLLARNFGQVEARIVRTAPTNSMGPEC